MTEVRQRGQRKTQDPCPTCFLHKDLCICAQIPHLDLKTKLILIIHAKELKRTTNTGRLATHALVNSELLVRGLDHAPLDLSSLLTPSYRTLLFFPADDAEDLTVEYVQQDPRPIQLIVPDGNWRQASKVNTRHLELKDIPRVMIKAPNLASQHLRAETTPEGMATLQAIAEAFGVIEGADVRKALMDLYQAKLSATLKGRGQKLAE
jgi:DTW domain-containing protein YfiP